MSSTYEEEARRRPKSRNLRPLLRLTPFLARYRGRMVIALLALLAAAGATLVVPIAVRRIIDNGFSAANAALVDQYFFAMLAVVAVLALGSATRFYYVMWLGERIVADVRDALFGHLLKLSPGFFETQRSGEVVSRLTADTTQIKAAFSSTASIALRNLVMLTGTIVMMVLTSPKLAGLSLLALPLVVAPLVIYGRKVRSLSRQAQDTLASSAAYAQERLGAMTTVQANVQENAARKDFSAATAIAFAAAASRTFARAILTAAIIAVASGSIVMLLWYGASEVISGRLTAGTLSQFLIYAILAASSLGQLSEVWGEIQAPGHQLPPQRIQQADEQALDQRRTVGSDRLYQVRVWQELKIYVSSNLPGIRPKSLSTKSISSSRVAGTPEKIASRLGSLASRRMTKLRAPSHRPSGVTATGISTPPPTQRVAKTCSIGAWGRSL